MKDSLLKYKSSIKAEYDRQKVKDIVYFPGKTYKFTALSAIDRNLLYVAELFSKTIGMAKLSYDGVGIKGVYEPLFDVDVYDLKALTIGNNITAKGLSVGI